MKVNKQKPIDVKNELKKNVDKHHVIGRKNLPRKSALSSEIEMINSLG